MLLLILKECEFNVGIIVLKNMFQYTVSLCTYLQKPNIDLIQALDHIDNVERQLHSV